MTDRADRAAATRQAWLATIERHRHDRDAPGSTDYWSPRLDTASREELRTIQNDKIAAVAPFLYENSDFYRRRFDRLGLIPPDLRTVDDLISKWPVVDKLEMAEDAAAHPPYGTYTAMTDAIWAERGWMMFSSSGTTGAPRVFRYSQVDRELWAWANARALQSMDFRKGDTVFMITGYGPHVWAWGVSNTRSPRWGCRPCRAAAWTRGRAPTSSSAISPPFSCARRPMRCISGAPWRRSASIRAQLRPHAFRRW